MFPYSCLELGLFSFCLLFQSLLLFKLLLNSGLLEFLSFLSSNLSLNSIFFSGSSLIGFNSSFSPQCIKLCLPVRCFFLQFPKSLNFLFFLVFNSPEYLKNYFCSAMISAYFSAFSRMYCAIFSSYYFYFILRCSITSIAFLFASIIYSLVFLCFSLFFYIKF